MNFNDIFYKPKRESSFSVVYNRRRKLVFLTSLALVLSLSSDISNEIVYKRSSKDKINDLKILSVYLPLYRNKFINESIHSENSVLMSFEQVLEMENGNSIVKRVIPIIEGPAEFARYIRNLLKDIPNEVKYNYILEHFKHTPFEIDVMQAVTCKEAKPDDEYGNRYVDAFSVINSIYNRMCSKTKCGYVKYWTGKTEPITMYDHIIAPGQYQPYYRDTYKEYLGHTTSCTDEAYQAFLDFLFIADKGYGYMTDKMDFLGNGYGYSYSDKYVLGGNEFTFPLTAKDTIPLEDRYYMVEQDINLDTYTEENTDIIDVPETIESESPSSESDIILEKDLVIDNTPFIILNEEDLFEEDFTDENKLTLQR